MINMNQTEILKYILSSVHVKSVLLEKYYQIHTTQKLRIYNKDIILYFKQVVLKQIHSQ